MNHQNPRKIIHCDCDCFYAAVEMRDNPSLVNLPIAVGGSAEARGVIATCNYVARDFGVRSAMATAHALKRCPNLVVLPVTMEKYRVASRQIHDIFRHFTDIIQPVSLDEAYLDVTDAAKQYGSATFVAQRIKQRIFRDVGITVSAGVAPNKLLAKIASDWQKPDGLFVIKPDQVDAFIASVPITALRGVGTVTSSKLHSLGVTSCADLQAFDENILIKHFGVFGASLYKQCRGIDNCEVQTQRIRKSVSVETTYSTDVKGEQAITEALEVLFLKLETRYRQINDNYSVTGIKIKVKYTDFNQLSRECATTDVTLSSFKALIARHKTDLTGYPIRLLGVGYRLQPREAKDPKGNDDTSQQLLFD